MHRPLTAAALAAAALALAGTGAEGAAAKPRRPAPWATVNVCDTPQRPLVMGVRVFVPRRGTAAQWARIRVQWFDDAGRRWRRVRGEDRWDKLGRGRAGRFGGRDFHFPAPQPGHRLLLRGVVDVQWRKRGKVVARARVRTTAGHADRKDPYLQDSRRVCEITGDPAPGAS
jgi:hypothetical protein